MTLMTKKEAGIFSLIALIIILVSISVEVFVREDKSSLVFESRQEAILRPSDIYTYALSRRKEHEAWQLIEKDALERGINLSCSDTDGKTYGDCVNFWVKLADNQFIVDSLRAISQKNVRIVFTGCDCWRPFEVSNNGAVWVPMSTTLYEIEWYLAR